MDYDYRYSRLTIFCHHKKNQEYFDHRFFSLFIWLMDEWHLHKHSKFERFLSQCEQRNVRNIWPFIHIFNIRWFVFPLIFIQQRVEKISGSTFFRYFFRFVIIIVVVVVVVVINEKPVRHCSLFLSHFTWPWPFHKTLLTEFMRWNDF